MRGSYFPQYLIEDLTHKWDNKYLDGRMDEDIRIIEKKGEKGLDSGLNMGEK